MHSFHVHLPHICVGECFLTNRALELLANIVFVEHVAVQPLTIAKSFAAELAGEREDASMLLFQVAQEVAALR